MIVVNSIVERYLSGNKIVEYLIISLVLGVVCIVGSTFFEMPVVGLRYGVIPHLGGPDSGVFIGKYLTGISLLV